MNLLSCWLFSYMIYLIEYLGAYSLCRWQNWGPERLNNFLQVAVSQQVVRDLNTHLLMWNLEFFALCVSRFLWRLFVRLLGIVCFKRKQNKTKHFNLLMQKRRIDHWKDSGVDNATRPQLGLGNEIIRSWGDLISLLFADILSLFLQLHHSLPSKWAFFAPGR